MLRIAHAIESVDPRSGGTSGAFCSLVRAIGLSDQLEVRAFASGEPAEPLAGLETTSPAGVLRPGGLASESLPKLRSFEPHVVHLHGLFSADLVAIAKQARQLGARTVWQPHGMLVRRAYMRGRLKKALFARLGLGRELASAGCMLYCTPYEQEHSAWHRGAARARHEIVPLPLDLPTGGSLDTLDHLALREEGRQRLGIGDRPVVGFLGRLHPVKRVELVLNAFACARESRPTLELAILGDGEPGYTDQLRAHAAGLGVGASVRWLGWIKPSDRWALLAGVDALVVASMFENFGYVAPEAMAVGTPVAITSNLAMSETVDRLDAGSSRSEVPEDLARGIAEALDRSRAGVAERGRGWIEQELSASAVSNRLESLYATLAQPANGEPS